ncbi:translesion error-prone DNA polymerase V subunit UmuC [Marinobacter changyiensis]|uniref:translesion error-prone DNA polymerase V subunit UmuC n=1 Tax=Marinobacter changyiensis TaxID=2604091 RepID=UPI00126403EE|nr:translesion error-prone DNA polymerase V subunit UmuC [Marinobacter changyiensis]
MTVYALCDANSFYASVEQIFQPAYRGRPLIVLSNNDGCTVARSKEAKRIGIKMGAPLFMIRDLVRRHNVVVCSSNYALYGDMSDRFMQTLEELSPKVMPYSIDEAFLDLTGVRSAMSLLDFGHQVKDRVAQWTGLPICVGVSTTLTLAKLANHGAKQYPKTGGVVDLTSLERQQKLLAITPVEEIWGIGSRLAKRLKPLGIATGLDLSRADPAWIRSHFSVVVERTAWELRGVACQEIDEVPPTKQQIVCSRSFGQPVTDLDNMLAAVTSFATRAAEKIRGEERVAGQISAFLSTNRFAEGPRYSNSASQTLPYPSSDTRVLVLAATKLITQLWRDGFRFNKAGVMLMDFREPMKSQGDMFDRTGDSEQDQALMTTLDNINRIGGSGTVKFARQTQRVQPWAMRREHLSPAFTTRWSDLPRAR